MLRYFTFLTLLLVVLDQHQGVTAESNPNPQNVEGLQKLPCNKNHNHEDDELTAVLAQSHPEDNERAGNEQKSMHTRRFVNQLSADKHILNQEEFQRCQHAKKLLGSKHNERNVEDDSNDSLNEDNANNAPFHYQALRRKSQALNLKPETEPVEKEEDNDNEKIVPDPPSPSGSPLTNYEFQRRMMLLKNKRICYACSSASNPTCAKPDRSTTIKYCSPEQDACVVKSYVTHSKTKVIVRDCATSCHQEDPLNISPKYKKCTMCKDDLCNSAYFVSSRTALIFATVYAFIALFKAM